MNLGDRIVIIRDFFLISLCSVLIIFAGCTSFIHGATFVVSQEEEANTLHITGNEELLQKAAENDWPGTGTAEDPITIEGLSLWGDMHIFTISSTDLYVNFTNNRVQGFHHTWCSLVITLTRNVIICNNTIFGGAIGVHILAANETLVTRNTIYDTGFDAVFMDSGSTGNIVVDNYFYDNGETGVMCWTGATENVITDNLMIGGDYGVCFRSESHSNHVFNNTIESSQLSGICLETESNEIVGNIIYNSLGNGLQVFAPDNHISNNIVIHSRFQGVYLAPDSNRTEILHNSLVNCTLESILIMDSSRNIIRYNDFLGDSEKPFAKDNGYLNVFERNFWENYLSTDANHDGVFDTPYDIDGEANNRDNYPVTSINNPAPMPEPVHSTETTNTSTSVQTTTDGTSNTTLTNHENPIVYVIAVGFIASPVIILMGYRMRKSN